jgi:hypothetical protein
MTEVLIRKGESFTCARGHYIGRAAQDIALHQRVTADLFEDMAGKALGPHDSIGLCTCGAWWLRYGSFHTAEGWKPEPWSGQRDQMADVVSPGEHLGIKRHGPEFSGPSGGYPPCG